LKNEQSSLKTLEELEHYIQTRGNEIMLTPPRPMKVGDAAQDLERLFDELVGGRSVGQRQPAFMRQLKQAMDSPQLVGRVQRDVEVIVPIAGRKLDIPYAYQNGVLNLIKPKVFQAGRDSAIDTAMRLVTEGQLLANNPVNGKRQQLVIVHGFDSDASTSDLQRRMGEVFDRFKISHYPGERVDDLIRLVNETAHAA
jgi:hypothetical protein